MLDRDKEKERHTAWRRARKRHKYNTLTSKVDLSFSRGICFTPKIGVNSENKYYINRGGARAAKGAVLPSEFLGGHSHPPLVYLDPLLPP